MLSLLIWGFFWLTVYWMGGFVVFLWLDRRLGEVVERVFPGQQSFLLFLVWPLTLARVLYAARPGAADATDEHAEL